MTLCASRPCYGSSMSGSEWKTRLKAAVAEDGRSLSAVSVAAGHSRNYLSQLLQAKGEPLRDNFLALCRAMKISPSYIMEGDRMGTDIEELNRLLLRLPVRQRSALLALIYAIAEGSELPTTCGSKARGRRA
jgi:hypothetical protein